MDKDLLSQTGYQTYLHEFLFSLNIALALKWVMAQVGSYSELTLQLWINGHLNLHPHNNIGGYTAFFIYALGLALCIFLLLRIFSIVSLVRKFFRSVAGIVSLLFLPASWFYVTHLFPVPPGLPNPPRAWLLLELAAAIACTVLYLFEKWPFPGWSSVLLLTLHFGFWYWLVFGGFYFWLDPVKLVFPIAGFCSTLVWGLYISHQSPAHSVRTANS